MLPAPLPPGVWLWCSWDLCMCVCEHILLLFSLMKAKSIHGAGEAGNLLRKETLRELFAWVRREGGISSLLWEPCGKLEPFPCRAGASGGEEVFRGRRGLQLLRKFKAAPSG